ncbi:MATE family efflux transporter [Demequina gelatinilytica]|uniref:MATE family efflux transporter n=1 Tax=Demequina gelatinilytica TaxID=1638980 RepID=UPI00078504AC|nr:MATE family efflux transporter [Demequina gelatinilytica]
MTRSPARADELGARPLGPLLWESCLHTTMSVGVYGVYALTNTWFVARMVGETALAAVALATPLLLLVGAVSTTVGVGAASLVARALGAGRRSDAARATGNAIVLFWSAAGATTVLGLTFLDPLLRLLGATAETMPYARPYAAVILAGALVSTGFSAIVRAEGRIGFSTLLWVIPVALQIALDPLLIMGLDMGVAGAALGTVGGQAVSALMSLWFFFAQPNRPYRITLAHLRPRLRTLGTMIAIGAPSFLAGIGATIVAAVVNASLATAGAAALAAFAVCARVQTFVTMPQTGITQGAQPVVSYSSGAGLADRVGAATRIVMRSTVVYGAVACAVVLLAAEPLVAVFLGPGPAHGDAATALRIVALGFVFSGVAPLVSGLFQATGSPKASYAVSVGSVLLIRLPLVATFATFGPNGIWVALALGELVSAIAALGVMRRVRHASRAMVVA